MNIEPNVKLLAHTPNPENVVSMGAKLCYSPLGISELETSIEESDNSKFIQMLSNIGHESPIEHVSFTFGIEGVSRAFTHQLVRHRIASYSQKSQRYVKEGQFEYIIPEAIKDNKALSFRYRELMEILQEEYDFFVEEIINEEIEKNHTYVEIMKEGRTKLGKKYEKYAIENARYILPNACETKIVVTMNARTLLNFFELRTCRRAQTEIREVAEKMYWLCLEVAPSIFKNRVASCISRGRCTEGKMSCLRPRNDLK